MTILRSIISWGVRHKKLSALIVLLLFGIVWIPSWLAAGGDMTGTSGATPTISISASP